MPSVCGHRIEQGWLRFTQVGGVDPRILPGLEVTVHGKRELPGVVAQPPGAPPAG
jgi:endoglucanase